MIDFHTHVLPGIDDGSPNTDMSIQMMKQEFKQGVEKVVFTPHFYAHKQSVDHFLSKREKSLWKLEEALEYEEEEVPDYLVGAEVFYFPGMGKAEVLPELCIGGSDTILIEMPFTQWDADIVADIHRVINRQRMNVILAHVERYVPFQKDFRYWDEIMEMPVVCQMNYAPFLHWKGRRFPVKFLKEGNEVIFGTDCHNMSTRAPELLPARTYIEKKLGEDILEECDDLAEHIWRKIAIETIRNER